MRITRVYLDIDMRQAFEGLRGIAKKEATESSVVFFMNRKATSFKMLVNNQYLVYYKNGNRRIPLDAIQHLPKSFGGSEAEMNSAIRKSLEGKLKVI